MYQSVDIYTYMCVCVCKYAKCLTLNAYSKSLRHFMAQGVLPRKAARGSHMLNTPARKQTRYSIHISYLDCFMNTVTLKP